MRPPRILVVDDTAEVRSFVRRVLEPSGYDITEACDGEAAIAACDHLEGQFDLLLTDVKMPGMSGFELADRITGQFPAIGVLYISGQFEGDQLQLQLTRTGARFISKPFLPQVLLSVVWEMAPPAKGPAQADSSTSEPPLSGNSGKEIA
jgi:CheY-like chemotaxis protein